MFLESVCIVLGAALAYGALRRRLKPEPALQPFCASGIDFVLAGALACFVLLLSGFAQKFFDGVFKDDVPSAVFFHGIFYQFAVLAAVFAFWKFATFRFAFGFWLSSADIKETFKCFLRVCAYAFVLGVAINAAVFCATGELPQKQDVIGFFSDIKNPAVFVCAAVSIAVFAPFVEELLFRCFLYRILGGVFERRFGAPAAREIAAVAAAAIFAAAHGNAAAFIPLFFVALLLTSLYERTGSIIAPMLCHGMFNLLNMALILLCNENL